MSQRFINAAKDGYLDMLVQATKRDLNVADEDGMTAVMWAAHNGHLDALRIIVGRGGDVDRCDYLGLTALHHAAQKGLMHVVTYLVNWGANIYALDNDHHSALDLASLHDRNEIVQYLDQVYSQQQTKNPKHASRLREEAVRHAERNLRRYHKLQAEAARRVQKEQRKHTFAASHEGLRNGGGGGQSKNFIKSLTMAIRPKSKTQGKAPSSSGMSYSDIAGLSRSVGTRSSAATRLRRSDEMNGSDSHLDSGRRTAVSERGVHGASSEVLYMADGTSSRPAVYDVFGSQERHSGNLELETKDSGVDSYFGDEEDEESAPGMFNRPGFGKTAFLTGSNFLNTLPSFEPDGEGEGAAKASSTNGYSSQADSKEGTTRGSVGQGSYGEESWSDTKELPWDQEDVDKLDDDDEGTPTSALEAFLWSAGLEVYLHKFLQEKVDMELVVKMSDADLKEIGLPFGPRKRLLEAVKRRQEVLSLPRYMTDSYL
ncbi:hypothetical protein ACOMHN_007159 [Nucella lapillus]